MSFKRLEADDFVVSSDSITSTLWSTDLPTLTEFYTSSVQAAGSSGNFYLSVYQTSSLTNVQFDIAYANASGSGSTDYTPIVVGKSPSLSTYGQYRALILEDENSTFSFGVENNIYVSEDFWVLSLERARYKESIFPGSLNLTLSGSDGIIQLTDNSQDVLVNTFIGSSRVYQLVSGSNGSAISSGGYVENSGSYGLVFPELGTILLNPSAISQSIGVDSNRTSNIANGTNMTTLYNSIVLGSSFSLNSQETITSDYIFIRARNSEFNYTQNPTFISGATGEVIYDNFINNPQTFITTIGLYNDSNELLSVAKLSRPLIKDFTKEALVRVKLDF
jgi:hypothetical protein